MDDTARPGAHEPERGEVDDDRRARDVDDGPDPQVGARLADLPAVSLDLVDRVQGGDATDDPGP